MYNVYFAKSLKSGKIYVGFTQKEPLKRIEDHNTGTNNWSRYNKPLKLVYYESFECKKDALKRERFYKT